MSISDTTLSEQILTEEILARFHQRAPIYDRENRFFYEDFEELRDSGYLTIAVPRELGGQGLTLAEVSREQRRLAYYAPATALAINMHLYWTGVAADLWRSGDRSLEWLLHAAIDGAIFAAGHAEAGNDIPIYAERVEGGYCFRGRQLFSSLTPVWSFLGIQGIDKSDPAAPKIIHAFLPVDAPYISVQKTWDALGMRATSSEDTILDNVVIPNRYITRVLSAGAAGADDFILAMNAWSTLGFASVYAGIAQRALDLTVESVRGKHVLTMTRSIAYPAEVQHSVGEMVLELEALTAHLEKTVEDWSAGVSYGPAWSTKITAAKYHCVESAWRVVDRAFDLAGNAGVYKRNEIERLLRDARMGRVNPPNSMLAHEQVAQAALGIHTDKLPG